MKLEKGTKPSQLQRIVDQAVRHLLTEDQASDSSSTAEVLPESTKELTEHDFDILFHLDDQPRTERELTVLTHLRGTVLRSKLRRLTAGGFCAVIRPSGKRHPLRYSITKRGSMATKVSAEWFVRHYVERGPGDLNRARTILPTEEASWISVTREEQDFLNSKLRELRENRSLRRGQSASQVIGVPSPPTGEGALDPHEIVARGEGLYQQRLKTLLEKTKRGHYLVINVKTGEYVIETTGVAARKTFDKLYPGAPSYSLRIGIPISA